MAKRGEHEIGREALAGGELSPLAGRAPGKVTRSGLFADRLGRSTGERAAAAPVGTAERMGDWDPASLTAAMGIPPQGWTGADKGADSFAPGRARTLAMGQGEAPQGAAPAAAHAHAAAPAIAPPDGAIDLTDPTPRGPAAPTATMHVRALDASGALVDEWIGPAFFTGELPTSYQAERTGKGWRWTRDGAASSDGAKLKLDSDARGKAGRTLAEWAPHAARVITCHFVARTAPFGADASPLATDSAARPSQGVREADGAAPISESLGAALDLEGPEAPGTFRTHGELTIDDQARRTTITLGKSTVALYGAPSEYLYRIAPQTSHRQRVIQITASFDVGIETYADPTSPIELVPQTRRVTRDELATLRAEQHDDGALRLRRPEISASGDAWRTELRLGASAITITALEAGARFAYWVAPEWSGDDNSERAVYVVATPGTRIDEAADERGARDGRRLRAHPIYVQDPRQVPQQGEPIDPSRFLGLARHDNTPPEVTPHPANRNAFQVATSGTGIAVRDLQSRAALRIFADDPTLGARFRYEVEGKQVRVLVGKGARVEIEQARVSPTTPNETPDPMFDFGQVEFQIYQAREDRFPSPDTPLSLAALQSYGTERGPDAVHWVKVDKSAEQVAGEAAFDVTLGSLPIAGDVIDLVDVFSMATTGTDKWGNELSLGEKIATAIVAVLPLATSGVVMGARRLAGASGAAAALAKAARKTGRTEEEVHALLATVRKLDDEGRAAARRIERAVELGEDVAPADLLRLEAALGRAGLRTSGVAAPKAARFGAGASATPLPRTSLLEARERELQQALRSYAKKLGVRGKLARARVEVLPKAHFVQRFGSEQARAVCQVTEDGPRVFARVDATPHDLLDEAAHLAQLADPKTAPALRYLDERNLEDWPALSVPDRLGFYEAKIEIEIDAKRRALHVVRDEADRRVANAALEDLGRRKAELEAIDPADVARMASGEMPAPQFLSEPPRLFGKQRKVIEEIPSPPGSANLTDAGRKVDATKGSADYSGAYSMEGVTEVRQRGNSWYEIDYVTSDLQGKIVSRTVDEEGATHIVVEGGGARRDHIFEPDAAIDPKMKPGRKVEAGERLGKDSAREYRRVELAFADGAKVERVEIRTRGSNGKSWVQRGQESTARGTAAEERARAAADVDLAARKAKGEISDYFHIPHRVGGGGFDDVIVEFAGEGEAMQVKVRIREVKDYANRYLSISDLSSVVESWQNNIAELSSSFSKARDIILNDGVPRSPFDRMGLERIEAALRAIRRDEVHLELVLSDSTRMGTGPGSRVEAEIRRLHRRLNIRRM